MEEINTRTGALNMNHVTIIAEAGVNHNGSLELAQKLVDAAKNAGADIVKFQTANLNSLVSSSAQMAEYQKQNIGSTETQKEMLSKLLLSQDDFLKLYDYCQTVGIEFLSTPFDIESINFLKPLVRLWKVPSGEITNYPYLVEIAKTHKPVIMSTGMADLNEIRCALEILRQFESGEISLLHCTTQYPASLIDVNLRAMQTLSSQFGCEVGYSDHTEGIEIPVAAVALGAKVIEKHLTLDRTMQGPDHKASLEPHEMKEMVANIRNVELALGDGEKKVQASEIANRNVARKSIVAKYNIKKGERFTVENITTKRPGNGISPMLWNEILGTIATRDFAEDELIEI